MKNKTKLAFIALKLAIFIISTYLIIKYVGNTEYDCDKKCILTDAGKFFGGFTTFAFIFLFCEKTRHKTLDILKIYIPAIFLLFSGIYYIETTQHEQNINMQKEYIAFKLQYVSTEIKNIPKKEFDDVIGQHLKEYNSAFEKYNNKVLNDYKTIVGRAMIGLTIGLAAVLIIELLKIQCREENSK